ncbi:hypothetical protein, partial [Streptosporangium roseum]|uniref:hypothetical protein n=1 Tax=Streptosporangium roseum TaxID=2001 RepID=UPI00055CD860
NLQESARKAKYSAAEASAIADSDPITGALLSMDRITAQRVTEQDQRYADACVRKLLAGEV